MHLAFAVTFGVFLVLMAVLVVFVVRFAVREGRRRKPQASIDPDSTSFGRPDAGKESTPTNERPGGDCGLDEPSSAALVDDPDEGGDR